MEKKSIETKVTSEMQEDNTWKSLAYVTVIQESDEEIRTSNYEVMSFDDNYEKSVAVVTFAIYKFLSEDIDKEASWKTVKKVKTND